MFFLKGLILRLSKSGKKLSVLRRWGLNFFNDFFSAFVFSFFGLIGFGYIISTEWPHVFSYDEQIKFNVCVYCG